MDKKTKSEWRRYFREQLSSFVGQDSSKLVQANQQICQHLLTFLRNQNGLWAGYQAIGHEPIVHKQLEQLQHLQWVYPVVDGEDLQFREPGRLGFRTGAFGINEPAKDDSHSAIATSAINGFLVPGLGFDEGGYRLGRGRGFYDRALAHAPKAVKVGIAYNLQMVGELPHEDFDVPMDFIITEAGVTKLR